MTKIKTLKIPAHEIVSLQRGGTHIMIFDLPAKQGKKLNSTEMPYTLIGLLSS